MKRQLEALYARAPLGMRLGLDAMRAACARFGHPEASFPSVHVAGTNGKGSVCAMVESIARAAGLKTGMYTSPHLVHFSERIRINGEPIPDDELTLHLGQALTAGLSFFETATLAAFLAFRAHKVDLAIVEVGLGGRLDATNVLPAETVRCSAVTKIAMDHTDMLGDTLALIAAEKAAIARPGVPLVHGALPTEAEAAVHAAVERVGATLVRAREHAGPVGLAGAHQRHNAGIAATVAAALAFPPVAVDAGIAMARWPGRIERIRTARGEYILDGAHNPDGMAALVAALSGERVGAIVFGALADKSWRSMLEQLASVAWPRIYVQPAGRAAAALEDLEEVAAGVTAASVRDALAMARRAAKQEPVVLCGSLYLVGEARAALLGLRCDSIVAL